MLGKCSIYFAPTVYNVYKVLCRNDLVQILKESVSAERAYGWGSIFPRVPQEWQERRTVNLSQVPSLLTRQPQDGQSPASIPLILSPVLQTNVSYSPTPTRDFPFKCAGD